MLAAAAIAATVSVGVVPRAPAIAPEEVDAATAVARGYVAQWGTVRHTGVVPSADGAIVMTPSMRLAEDFAAAEIEDAQVTGSQWGNASPTVRVTQTQLATDTVIVRGALDVDYCYADAPEIESAVRDIGFRVKVERSSTGWAVSEFEADLDAYRAFLGVSVADATADSAGVAAAPVGQPGEVSMLRPVTPTTRVFSNSAAAAYAKRFATAPVADRLFYTAGADCTNFVSQCVWAGYGGWVSGDEALTRSNIRNKVRMVPGISYADPDGWYGGTGGGISTWESVGAFYRFCSAGKALGPRAQAANNGAKWTSLPGAEIGSVLQLRSGPTGAHKHSIIVSSIDTKPIGPKETIWNHTYASAHSTDYKNRRVSEFIAAFGGANCYLRRLTFGSAPFVR
jgi:hypothetical protein